MLLEPLSHRPVPSATQPFTIERVGDGAFVAHVDQHDLHLSATEGTPRTRDLDLAAWLGFERPHDIRKLIRRMIDAGKLRDVEVFATVAKTSGGRPGKEFWLTREQALLVATQSDTPRAWALVELMVKVFDGVLAMLRAPAPETLDRTSLERLVCDAIARATEPLRAEIDALRERAAPALMGDCIGRRTAREDIQKPVRAIASRLATLDPLYSRKQHIGRLYVELREAIGVSLAPRFEDFDAEQLRAARGWIRARHRDIERREGAIRGRARKQEADAQGSLDIN